MTPALRTTVTQDDFSDGMVRDVAPQLIPESGAYDMVNVLLDEDGSPYRRGGTEYVSGSSPSTTPILDNFNRPDEDPVSKGGKWVGPLDEAPRDLQVKGEHLAAPEEAGSAVFDQTVTNGAVYATVGAGTATIELAIRTAAEGTADWRGYFLSIVSEGTSRLWALGRRDHEAAGAELTHYTKRLLSTGDSISITAVGTQISVWHKTAAGGTWERVLVAHDSTYTSGRLAVVLGEGGTLDDFGGGTLTTFSEKGLTWLWDGYLGPGKRTFFSSTDDFGVLSATDEMLNLGGPGLDRPKQSVVIKDLLFVGGGTIYGGSRKTAPYSTGTVKVETGSKVVTGSGTTWNTLVDAGMLLQIGSGRVYVVEAVESTTKLILRDAYEGEGGSGNAYTLHNVYSVGSDPYETWDYLTVCANRLVTMSGRTIKYTEVNNPHTFTNSLGTTNEHTLPEGVEGVGLATVGQTVLIFHTGGIHVLDGLALDIVDQNGNPQHRLQQLSEGTVLAGATGIAGSGQQLVVPCEDGIYLMDGISQPTRVSRPVELLYRQRIAAGYLIGQARVFRGHYLLPIITGAAKVKTMLVCRLDRPTRSRHQAAFPWSRFSGHGGEIPAFTVTSSVGASEPQLLGASGRDAAILDCSAFFEPDEDHELDADGTCHDLDIICRDLPTGAGTINVVRAVKPRYELRGSQGPKLQLSYSPGTRKASGAKWGQVKWGQFLWSGNGESFRPIGEAGESNGRDPARLRLNKKLRYARIRIKSFGPASVCALRSLELTIRPSGATRR